MKESHLYCLLANAWLIGSAISEKWGCIVMAALWIAVGMYAANKEKKVNQ